jgi:hypothetical protein
MTTKPIARRSALRSIIHGTLGLVAVAATGSISACNAEWWQNLTSNPGAAQQFISYVTTFLQAVASIWGIVSPLIPSTAQQQAQVDYANAVFTVDQGVAVLEDGLKAAAAAKQSNPDFSAVIANVQAAIDALMKIVSQWQGSTAADTGDGGLSAHAVVAKMDTKAQMAELVRQQGVIHRWK